MTPSEPFRRGKFSQLPELPHRPHAFHRTTPLTVTVDDPHFGALPVHVRTYGQGPPLLLIHGLMTTSYSWRYAFEGLGQHFKCYAPDLPGAGRTPPAAAHFGPRALAGWIANLQTALGISGCAMIGNSMGGYLCMQLALAQPDAMSGLVNLHSPGVPEPRLYALAALLRVPGVKRALGWVVRRDPDRWTHRNVHYYDESYKSLEEAREYGDSLRSRAGVGAFIKYLRETLAPGEMRRFMAQAKARPFPVPLMLVYAERDPMVPPRVGDMLHEAIPDAVFVSLGQASHFAHVDATDRFLAHAVPFLLSVSSAGPGPADS